MNDTYSLSIFVQFPIRAGMFPDSVLPSILLQSVSGVLESREFKTKKCQIIHTYKSVKFLRLLNESGIVPVKLLPERRLQETIQYEYPLNMWNKGVVVENYQWWMGLDALLLFTLNICYKDMQKILLN